LKANGKCEEAWETLKERLCSASTLAFPNFRESFILYTDGSKERGFGAALHQLDKGGEECPVLFSSRSLSEVETRYWATELEAGALVWALTKLPQYFDGGQFTVVVDHSALKSALQTNTTGRRSNRLNEWGMYLSTFLPRMKIIPERFWLQSSSAMGTSRRSSREVNWEEMMIFLLVLRFSAGDSFALEAFEVAFTGFDTTHAFLPELCSYGEPVQGYYCWLRGKR